MTGIPNAPAEALASLVTLAAKSRTLKKLVFSKPSDKAVTKTVCELCKIGESTQIQTQTFRSDNKVIFKNYEPGEFVKDLPGFSASFSQINLITSLGECEYKRSVKGKETLIGDKKL